MHELTLDTLPRYAEQEPKLVTALFSLSDLARRFDEAVAPKSIDVWIARNMLELNAFSTQVIPVGKIEDLPYHLYIATTEITQSYVLVPSKQRMKLVTEPLRSGICL
jgi:hypothetical protein